MVNKRFWRVLNYCLPSKKENYAFNCSDEIDHRFYAIEEIEFSTAVCGPASNSNTSRLMQTINRLYDSKEVKYLTTIEGKMLLPVRFSNQLLETGVSLRCIRYSFDQTGSPRCGSVPR